MTVIPMRYSGNLQGRLAFGKGRRRRFDAEAGGDTVVAGRGRRSHRGLLAAAIALAALLGIPQTVRFERGSVATRAESGRPTAREPSTETVVAIATSAVDAPSLLSVADAERLSGNVDGAKRTYVALRSRFQTSIEAGHAAFWIGEVEFSNRKDYADAALWFSTYLREQPRGAFAVHARARLMESLYRIADWGGALRVANEYLSQYPDGPDSKLALAILNDEALPE